MSFAANVADWRCLIAIVGIMLAGSYTPKTKFFFLKKSLFSSKASSRNFLHSFRV